MTDYLAVLDACIRKAPDDPRSAAFLRSILKRAAERGNMDTLIALGEAFREQCVEQSRRKVESN